MLPLPLEEGVSDTVGLAVSEGELVSLLLLLGEGVSEHVGLALKEAELVALLLPLDEGVAEWVGVGLSEAELDTLLLGDGVTETVRLKEVDGEVVGVIELV